MKKVLNHRALILLEVGLDLRFKQRPQVTKVMKFQTESFLV